MEASTWRRVTALFFNVIQALIDVGHLTRERFILIGGLFIGTFAFGQSELNLFEPASQSRNLLLEIRDTSALTGKLLGFSILWRLIDRAARPDANRYGLLRERSSRQNSKGQSPTKKS